jgi:hypothetical protein
MHDSKLSRSMQAVLLTLTIVALGGVTTGAARAQVSNTLLVDTDPGSSHPTTRCKDLTQSGVGSVRVCATVSKPAGQVGRVQLTVTRLSIGLWGETQINGILQCGSGQKIVNHFNIRPTVFSGWSGLTVCPNSQTPIVFYADIAMIPL